MVRSLPTCFRTIKIIRVRGVEMSMPIMLQIQPHTESDTRMAMGEMFSRLPAIFGSSTLPKMI